MSGSKKILSRLKAALISDTRTGKGLSESARKRAMDLVNDLAVEMREERK